MANSKRAQNGKPRIQPRGRTYVEPKVVSQGLERVREAATHTRINAFASFTRGKSRMSGNPHVRICAGCALKVHRRQQLGIAALVTLSQQPSTESCVCGGDNYPEETG